ncbi:MAG TPA: hypothetical protein DCM73_03195 [Clostridiales bacterium]|nr:hypothetical protein [Clostridiales bacterium]
MEIRDLMFDPDFADFYKVKRRKIMWINGRPKVIEENILNFYGPVQPTSPRELEQFPEGDRQKGIVKFFCSPPNMIYITDIKGSDKEEDITFLSDEILYQGYRYKVLQSAYWGRYGYIRAFGYSIGVDSNG